MKKFILIFIATVGLFFGLQAHAATIDWYTWNYSSNTYITSHASGCSSAGCAGQAPSTLSQTTYYFSCTVGGYSATSWQNLYGGEVVPVTSLGGNNFSVDFSGDASSYLTNFYTAVTGCVSAGPTFTLSTIPPAPPTSISFLFPTDGTTTSDFIAWHTSVTIPTTTDQYEACINSISSNGNFGSSCQDFGGSTTTAQSIDIDNQYAWSNYNTTTTVTSTAYLSDVTLDTGYIASSTPITFTVLPTASGNATGTYTPPLLATSSIFNATSGTGILMSTSTCSGWGDVGCALGNVFSNTINFLFGIDQPTIETIAGFQLANTQPWSFIPEIANDFQNQGQQTGSFATSTISFNLGNGNSTQVAFFSSSTVHKFIPDSAAALIRNIIYLMLIMEIGYMVYIEIKNIFGKPKA